MSDPIVDYVLTGTAKYDASAFTHFTWATITPTRRDPTRRERLSYAVLYRLCSWLLRIEYAAADRKADIEARIDAIDERRVIPSEDKPGEPKTWTYEPGDDSPPYTFTFGES